MTQFCKITGHRRTLHCDDRSGEAIARRLAAKRLWLLLRRLVEEKHPQQIIMTVLSDGRP